MQTMTVAENLLLNNEPTYGFGVIRRQRRCATRSARLLEQYEIDVAPDAVVSDLPNDLKKMVQIVKAVSLDPRVLLLDEPTSSLTDAEVRVALRLIRTLADERRRRRPHLALSERDLRGLRRPHRDARRRGGGRRAGRRDDAAARWSTP